MIFRDTHGDPEFVNETSSGVDASLTPNELVKLLRSELSSSSKAAKAERLEIYCERCASDPILARANFEIVYNLFDGRLDPQPKRIPREHVVRGLMKSFSFLKWPMPNGKQLGMCTGREVRKFAGWFQAVGTRVGLNQLVIEVLSEDRLRSIYNQTKTR
jgi:hypothetical protein